jgi:hypothetical protein
LFTAEKAVTISGLKLELPIDPVAIITVDRIAVRLYRNSYTSPPLWMGDLLRGAPVPIPLELQLSPGETLLGYGSVSVPITVEVEEGQPSVTLGWLAPEDKLQFSDFGLLSSPVETLKLTRGPRDARRRKRARPC